MSKSRHKKEKQPDIALQQFTAGVRIAAEHPLFSRLKSGAAIRRDKTYKYPENGLAAVTKDGCILCNPKRRAEPNEWARAIAHCLLHLAMGHCVPRDHPAEWNMACDCVVEKFLTDLKFGKPWYDRQLPVGANDDEKLYARLCEMTAEDKSEYAEFGAAGRNVSDIVFKEHRERYDRNQHKWPELFAQGLSDAVADAVRDVTEAWKISTDSIKNSSRVETAKQWFIARYPLLGAIAANFKIIEDPLVCMRMQIHVAAVSPALSEIYINPGASLTAEELRFVMAHEYLHAALRHDVRRDWRDAYFWNVACDFIINQWLTEMEVGSRPSGVLYDEQFRGLNAEAIYDRIVTDMRTYRKLATLRGVGLGDILSDREREGADVDLDAFYRRAISDGLEYHIEQRRGYLPSGLVEEIRALSHPPIPWDVELARWFDGHFVPLEKRRSYARPSRRQSATPHIPRPNWIVHDEALDGRTFGVVLDTSESMERSLLATALGAIASYSAARDVPAARVVFCDATAYDAGYMKPEDIAGTVKVKGRGGTILQPGIDLLRNAKDFPKDAPLLIITDGECDKLMLYGREHAFLLPRGARLPFVSKGKVFRIR